MSTGLPVHDLIGRLAEWSFETGAMDHLPVEQRQARLVEAGHVALLILTGPESAPTTRGTASWALAELHRFTREFPHDPRFDPDEGWQGSGADHAAFLYQLLASCGLDPMEKP
jgi:hypothetical protein